MSPLPPPPRLLSELVAIPSPSGDEGVSADYLADAAAAAGLDVERVGASVLCALEGDGPTFFLNTHHDTVPVGEGWDSDPLDPAWHGEGAGARLIARGANDAKASVAAMLTAAAGFARTPRAERRGTLLLAVTAAEETTNAGMGAVLQRLTERGIAPDGAVTGEPTDLEVVRAQSGLCVLEATWTGVSCHAAHVARVANRSALAAAAREVAQLPPYFTLDGAHPLLGESTLVATVLTAGERHNKIPDHALCVFDGRIAPPHSAEDCLALLAEHLPGAELRVRSDRLRPVETPAAHGLVRAALAATGRGAAIGSSTMSDMALLAGLPAVKCGPGKTARSHTPNEFLVRSELDEACAAYGALIPAALEALA
ncbi:MAG: M20/M25/M40 family metallo-hydrolase [Planctomycetota bacterium]